MGADHRVQGVKGVEVPEAPSVLVVLSAYNAMPKLYFEPVQE